MLFRSHAAAQRHLDGPAWDFRVGHRDVSIDLALDSGVHLPVSKEPPEQPDGGCTCMASQRPLSAAMRRNCSSESASARTDGDRVNRSSAPMIPD